MPFEAGNQLWQKRGWHGRRKSFDSAQHLWECCVEYFDWCTGQVIQEEKAFHFQGVIVKDKVEKMRAMTQAGLCVFIGIHEDTWRTYKDEEHDFSEVASYVDKIIYEQKLTGAAAGVLNASIISRELGLADKQEITTDTPDVPKSFNDFYGGDDGEGDS